MIEKLQTGIALGSLIVTQAFFSNVAGETEKPNGDGLPEELPAFVVTPNRSREPAEQIAWRTEVLDAERIRSAPSPLADDILRKIPTFSLFRRTSSLVAHPTTQGFSLRAVGPSGASRSLILYDGLPFNDAFGGWVYWNRLVLSQAKRVEIVRGGGSAAWGNTALGGIVHVIPREPEERHLEGSIAAGNLGTRWGELSASDSSGIWGVGVNGRYFRSDGFIRVHPGQRGPVDTRSWSRHRFIEPVVTLNMKGGSRLAIRGSYFEENRGNGTPLSKNNTRIQRLTARWETSPEEGVTWKLSGYGEDSRFNSTFSSVNDARDSEILVLDQFKVPSRSAGGSLTRTAEIGTHARWTVGTDFRWIEGSTNERVVLADGIRRAGGEQILAGTFGEGSYSMGNWKLSAALRFELWNNYAGFQKNPGEERAREFPTRRREIVSTRLGAVYQANTTLRLRGAFYQGYRVPTINELYRPFRVGEDATAANPRLDPEKLIGIEGGFDWEPTDKWQIHFTVFANRIRNPVANVTIGETFSGGRQRQRQNLDRSRVTGIESGIVYGPNDRTRIYLNHAWTSARVDKANQQEVLEGNRLAQTPLHHITAGLDWEHPQWGKLTLQAQFIGSQFEDDLNRRQLGNYVLFGAGYTRPLGKHIQLVLRAENLLDRQFPDGITGDNLVTRGTPRFATAGIRLTF